MDVMDPNANAFDWNVQAAARLAAIVESSEDAIISKTLDGIIATWNNGAERTFGYTAEEVIGRSISILIPEELQAEEAHILERLRLGERIEHYETERLTKGGRRIQVSLAISPIKDASGRVVGASKIIRDLTQRKQSEAAQLRQADFDTLITNIIARFAICTGPAIDEHIRHSLQELRSFIGAEAAFVILISPDMATWSIAYHASTVGGAAIVQKYQEVPLGHRSWIEQRLLAGETVQIATADDFPREALFEKQGYEREGVKSSLLLPLRGRGEYVTGCIGLRTFSRPLVWSQEDVRRLRIYADALANVLERKRVENDLYDSRQMLQQILDTIPQRVFWKDRDLKYFGCNKSFATDAGFPDVNSLIGKNDHELPWSGDNAEQFRADDLCVMESGVEKIGYEEPQRRTDGKVAWLRTSKMPLRDQQNRILGILGTYEDITDIRQGMEALGQAKEAAEAANRAKDQFIAVLSHELRTPLTPVLATLTALQEMTQLPDCLRADLDMIHRNVELEARLIDDLLDVTRISQGKINLRQEAVDVHACCRSALEICESEADAKHLPVVLKLEALHHFVWADPARLRQVLWNLLKNAIKFTPKQGLIEVHTSNDGERLRIEVTDTGIGIDSETLPRIFNAFEQGEQTRTRRFGGLGLGLSISKALVEMHHGKLVARSDGKDKGAVFTVELETVAPVAASMAPVVSSGLDMMESRKILLVEDHTDTLEILSRLLKKWGYGVTTATNVKSALESAAEQEFDLLISDLGLPDGSGRDVLRELQARYDLKGIALSGYGTDEDIRESLKAGFTQHLTKPVSFQVLRLAVAKLLKREE